MAVFCLSLFLFLSSCKTYETTPNKQFLTIQTGVGPEDLAVYNYNGESFIVASCAERRLTNPESAFYLIDPKSNSSQKMAISNLPDTIHLDLHGIDIETINGQTYLYAIDHNQTSKWQQIIRFICKEKALVFDKIFVSPEYLINPNDLDVDAKGNIYVSNSMGKGSVFWQYLLNQKKSSVVKYDVEEENF